jgi:chromosome segregation ATPase
MKQLTIQKLKIKNFKGIKDFEIAPAGKDLSVFGDNGTGKTTIADAFYWLLFNKDSSDKANFLLKPHDKDNNEIHNLETEVEVFLEFSGETIILKKVFQEKWTKKRGTAIKEHTGHTTQHFINNVPENERTYKTQVSELIDTNIFKMVTNPMEFNKIHWEDRRKILFDISGGSISDENVVEELFPSVADKDKLSILVNILNGSSVEDHKKIISAKKAKINKEIEKIPTRIDEVTVSMKELEPVDKSEKERVERVISVESEKLSKLKSNEAISEKRVEINNIDSEIIKVKNDFSSNKVDKTIPLKEEIQQLEFNKNKVKRKIDDSKEDLASFSYKKLNLEKEMDELRKKWKREDGKTQKLKTHCPTCNQELPDDEIEEALKKFNNQKSEALKTITDEGQKLSKRVDEINDNTKKINDELKPLKIQLKEKIKVLDKKNKTLVNVPADKSKPDTIDLEKQKEKLFSEIKDLEEDSSSEENKISEKIEDLKKELSKIETLELEHEAKKTSVKRISELEAQEKTLADEYEKLESEIFLIENFIVKKVEMLEDNINSKFKLARFKLFKKQINGGIDDCCETLHKGIQFNHGLNSAARINVGLDIISTLSEFYGFSAPVFIDNSESVNEINHIDTQIICLAVSGDKELTIK